ncbi:hypothetical protein Gasu2_24020 [Galdieria sulphuraria]|nr:hypothetical protein Gasu2_24020 [Galdieria sulphuraria]
MTEKVKFDCYEVGDSASNSSKLDVSRGLLEAGLQTEKGLVEAQGAKKESACCSESLPCYYCTCHREATAETLDLVHLQSVLKRSLLKVANGSPTLFIVEDLLSFAVAEVIRHRKGFYSCLCSLGHTNDGNTSNEPSCSSFSASETSLDVVNLSIFCQFLDEDERSQLNAESHCSYSFTSHTRKRVIFWLLDIAQLFDLNSETVALTVAFMDKLVGKRTISQLFFYSTIGGCLCTFSKWLDFRPEIILHSLDWHLHLRTVHGVFSKIAGKFRQFHWNVDLSEASWEEVVCMAEMYLNMSLLSEELTNYDHSIIILVVLGLVYKDTLKTNYMHKENTINNESALAELQKEIAKECGFSKECLICVWHLLESSVISNNEQ